MMAARGDRTLVVASHEAGELAIATHILWLGGGAVIRFAPAADVLRETVGSYRAEVTLPNRTDAEAWLDRAARCTPLRRFAVSRDGVVALYADAPLDRALRDHLADARSFAFGRTGYADLVRVCAQEATHG